MYSMCLHEENNNYVLSRILKHKDIARFTVYWRILKPDMFNGEDIKRLVGLLKYPLPKVQKCAHELLCETFDAGKLYKI